MSQGKKVYLEVIRIVAILLVIFNHTDGFLYYTETDSKLTWIFSIVLAVLCRIAVPLFFMVTGALLLEKEESFSELFRKRILRISVILFGVSLFYYGFDWILGRIEHAGVTDFLQKLLKDDIRSSFWFLYEYLFVLLLLPFFRKMAPKLNGTLMLYLVCLRGISTFALPLLEQFGGISVKFDIGFGSGLVYYVLLGYYLSREGEAVFCKIEMWKKCASAFGLIILNVVIAYLVYVKKGRYLTEVVDYVVFLLAPVIWLIMKELVENRVKSDRADKIFSVTGSCVFGIYLFDNLVRWQFLPFYLFLSEKTVGVFACSVYVLVTFIVGFFYTWILKKVPLISKYL